MEKNINIILCDNNSAYPERALGMMGSFENIANVYRLCYDSFLRQNDIIQYYPLNGKNTIVDSNTTHFLILLLHTRDINNIRDKNISYSKRIWYSGNGGENDSGMNTKDYRIKRKILDRNFLTPTEAQQLIDFAEGKIKKPDFLISPNFQEGIQVAIDIFYELVASGNIDDLDAHDEKIEPHYYLKQPWQKLKRNLQHFKKQNKEIPFLDADYMHILHQFQQEIGDIEETL